MKKFKYSVLFLAIFSSHLYASENNDYDLSLMHGDVSGIDISALQQANSLVSGTWPMTVLINDKSYGVLPVTVKLIAGKAHIIWEKDLLNSLPFSEELYDKLLSRKDTGSDIECDINHASMSLSCQVAQKEMRLAQTNYANKIARDDGVNALMATYRVNYSRFNSADNGDNDTVSAYLMGGANFGAWRARTSLYTSDGQSGSSGLTDSVVYRNFDKLNSQLKMGYDFTTNSILDSFRYKGISLATDVSMLPPDAVDFMPVVSGNVKTNATITVKKDGVIVYQENVPPGQYQLSSLPSIQGAFTVEEREADGSTTERTYYSSGLSQFIRKDQFRYEAVLGSYAGNTPGKKPDFILATAQYGLTQNLNLYGGGIYADDYNAFVFGSVANLGMLGAVSVDQTKTSANINTNKKKTVSGTQTKLQYSKLFDSTDTQLYTGFTTYGHGSYLNISDFADANDTYNYGYSLKSRTSLGITQSVGSKYVNVQYQNDTYKENRSRSTFSASLSGTLDNEWMNNPMWNIQYQESRYKNQNYRDTDRQLFASISVPLGQSRRMYLTQSMQSDMKGGGRLQTGISGINEDNTANYSLSYAHNSSGESSSNNVYSSAGYKGSSVGMSGYASASGHDSQYGGQLQGSLVVTADQFAISSQALTKESTIALVDTTGVSGAKVNQAQTSFLGTGLVDSLSPYRYNQMSLDATSLPVDAIAETTSRVIAPTKGAVAKASFNVDKKQIAVITLNATSKVPPTGAVVRDEKNNSIGMVSGTKEVYLDKFDLKQKRIIQWENGSCQLQLNESTLTENNSIKLYSGVCK
ncbi:fimbrial biogenesis outer membrane usher protein [Salmonella enterica subsp. enterica]|nr:fimbrial biogenesis outer membrane usher protein [Salmonella enterica subsp. enterica serovar Bonn]EBZ5939342.1 fimbrial biogenesis outer membrane usher protein [Salmonella enterica subsp. enterica serovar Muenchen]MLZ41085.1 fimbrial biogenesis outer membrane usher protein [Salmonella enterica subsp. enterica serovar Bonn]